MTSLTDPTGEEAEAEAEAVVGAVVGGGAEVEAA